MRSFDHPNFGEKDFCLVCKTREDKPVVLIGVVGTEDGGNMQARQVHVECIDLLYYPAKDGAPALLAQKL